MPMESEPVVGATYEDLDGREFEVLSFNEDEGTVGLRYVDESAEEIDIDVWYEMDLKRIKSPDLGDDEDDDEDDENDKPEPDDDDDDDEDDDDEESDDDE